MISSPPVLGAESIGQFQSDPMAFLLSQHARHGEVFAVELGGVPTVIFGGERGPAELFRAERGHLAVHNTPLVHELFGRAVFNLAGEHHRRARRPLRQAVTGRPLRDLTPTVTALVARHVAQWSQLGVFDLHEATRALTLDICARLILGLRPGCDDDQQFPGLFAAFVAAAEVDSADRGSDRVYHHGLAAAGELRAIVGRRVASLDGTPGRDVVSHLVIGGEVSPSEVGDHLLAVMIAARETTASLLTWMLIEIAQDPDLAQTAADESQTAGHPVSATAQALLWETERRHSPNIFSRRTVTADLATPYGVIPRGWHAAYSPAANHLLPGLFEDPWCFRPARFAGQAGVRRAGGLLTFGQGAHACPGKPFAELLAGTVAATVMRAHRLALAGAPPHQVRYLPVKIPDGPVRAVLGPRRRP
jgi:cytochrome P450